MGNLQQGRKPWRRERGCDRPPAAVVAAAMAVVSVAAALAAVAVAAAVEAKLS